jgi:hypothetical protein
MITRRSVPIAAAVLLLASSALAQAPAAIDSHRTAHNAVTLNLSTLGVGLEVNRLLTERIGVRVGGNYTGYGFEAAPEDISYRIDLQLRSFRAVADLYPFRRSSFHFTGGVLFSDNRVHGTATPGDDGSYTFTGNDYSGREVGTLTARVQFPRTAPYVGLGFSKPGKRGLRYLPYADVGVAFGTTTVSMHATGAGSNAQLASDLETEQRDVQSSLDRYPFYPVLTTGLSFRF